MSLETATLGGGCFWCLDAAFAQVKGVQSVVSGYAGGITDNPTYRDVSSGQTGHAEVVQIVFDGDLIDYPSILRIFFTIHDPTTLNRQGADVGTQYRSVIYYHSPEQEQVARSLMRELTAAGIYADPIVTQVEPVPTFYAAEDYHQDYYNKNPGQGYCQAVISPKLDKLRRHHGEALAAR